VIRAPVVRDKTLGYLYFMDLEHPLADAKGRVWHHRHVASVKLGRWVTEDEVVHHTPDHDRANNDPGNLEVVASNSEHMKRHQLEAGNALRTEKTCPTCGVLFMQRSTEQRFCGATCARPAQHAPPKIRCAPEELQRMLVELGMPRCARELGVSRNAIKKKLQRAGLWKK
jgi:endogenous inhibitor of DNA gyrase (YacG/DUF329 family)